MSSPGRPTVGMEIVGIRLFACDFSFEPDDVVKSAIAAQSSPPGSLVHTAKTEVKVVDANALQTPVGSAHVAILVTVTGLMGSVKVWGLTAGYQGVFRLSQGAEISMQDVLHVHGPAQLYAFARELTADLTRRAEVRMGPNAGPYFTPPWNFAARD